MNFSWEWRPHGFSISKLFLAETKPQKVCKVLKKYSGNTRKEDKLEYRIVKEVRKTWSEKNTANNNRTENKRNREKNEVLNTHKSEYSVVFMSSTSEIILLPWWIYLCQMLWWNIMRSTKNIHYPWNYTSWYHL